MNGNITLAALCAGALLALTGTADAAKLDDKSRFAMGCSVGDTAFVVYGGGKDDHVVIEHQGSETVKARDILRPFMLKRKWQHHYQGANASVDLKKKRINVRGFGTFDCLPGTTYKASLQGGNAVPAATEPKAQTPQAAEPKKADLYVPGLSYGGKVRGAPGMDGAQIGSLPEGAEVTIVANEGNRMNGFDWFQIEWGAQKRTGYQWGGILCAPGRDVPGMYRCQ